MNWVITAPLVVLVVIILLGGVLASRYTKVPPNKVLIVSGRKRLVPVRRPDGEVEKQIVGYRIVKGGGSIILPVVERVDILSLELMTMEVKTPEVYTVKGVPVMVDGIAQLKVKSDDVSIATAAEQFLGKPVEEIRRIATQTLEGHLRAILGAMTVEDIYKNRETFAQKVQEVAATDLANMGLEIISFTIRDIRDSQGYLEALGRPRIAEVKRDAEIGEANAQRDSIRESARAEQEGMTAKFEAETKIAEAKRNMEIQKADYKAAEDRKRAEADLAYELQTAVTRQQVVDEELKVKLVEAQRQIELEEREVMRRERELEAQVKRTAEADKYREMQVAEAQRYQQIQAAEAQARRITLEGEANADRIKKEGQAEADVIELKGRAEAEAMRQKAEAFKQYNEAAVVQMIIEQLPEIARAIAAPLSQTERIVVINAGEGGGGAAKLTRDITQVVAQVPEVVEGLTGVDLVKLLQQYVTKQQEGQNPGSQR